MLNYVVKRGDTLSLLSAKFFGNTSDYLKIYYANPQIHGRTGGSLSGANYIRTGETLKIPTFESTHAKPLRRGELSDKLSVLVNGKEIAVSNLQLSSAFDSTANAFSFDYPLFENGEIQPFGYEKLEISIGQNKILDGIIYDIESDGSKFKCSGKSFTALLENAVISGNDLGFSFGDTTIILIANRFAKQYGINFKADKGAQSQANRGITTKEFDITDLIIPTISKIAENMDLYLSCDNMNNIYFRPLDYLASHIGHFDNKDYPLQNLSVKYKGNDIFSLYSLYTGSDQNGEANVQNRKLELCKAQRIKRFKKDNKEQKDVLRREITKGLISCINVSFNLPFVLIKNKLIQPAQTFDLLAENYGIIKAHRFFISSITYNFTPQGASCQINACSAQAIENGQITEFWK